MRAALQSTSADLVIGRIGAPLAWSRWAEAKAFLMPALDRSDEEWPEVEAALSTDSMQLWVVLDGDAMKAATVTRIAQTKRGEVVENFLVGGAGMEDWLAPLNDEIAKQAKEIGCVAMRAYGREGWKPSLKALGWKVCAVAYEKAL